MHETSDIALGVAAEGANGFNEDFAIHAVAVRDAVADGAFFIIYRHAVSGKLDMGGAQGKRMRRAKMGFDRRIGLTELAARGIQRNGEVPGVWHTIRVAVHKERAMQAHDAFRENAQKKGYFVWSIIRYPFIKSGARTCYPPGCDEALKSSRVQTRPSQLTAGHDPVVPVE